MVIDEKAVFVAALALPDVKEREAYLQEACSGHPELLGRLRELLSAHEESQGPLDRRPVPIGVTVDAAHTESSGAVIGPYKLLEQIGEGGMGTVWMAQQTEPVKRVVALKLIKAGMDSKQVIARFEAERQALALMDHANIARVVDVGTTGTGRPYFVMDLVKGVPITKYCDEHHLTPRQRLELFIPVCQAVQHAHQKGIIHRDLKPSNVLVALYDGKPVPKVIDFGVAKAAGQPLTEQTLVTGFGAIVGTLEYMSPEQAEVNQLDIDTRSDIYSLGVLLYELLTGSPPFTRKDLERAGMLEMLRVIREEEPSKPSTKLSTAEGLPTLAANRGTEPAKLTRLVRGELDWIVMKALEKDRNRRYETANGFALDVQRYLADEPVLACPPSAMYRFRKFARRNKAALATAGFVPFFIVLLGGVVGWAMRDRAAREQEIALEADRQLALTEEGIRQALDRGTTSRAELQVILKKPGGVQHLLNHPARWELLIKTAQGELAQARRLAVRAEGGLDAEWTQAMDKFEQQLTNDQADYDLALRLEKIRLDTATLVEGRFDYRKAADEYPKAFAGFAVLTDDPAAVAARLASSPIKDQLVAALDDWAWTAFHLPQAVLTEQLLALARHAAPDPVWGDRLRQLKVWRDQEALGKLVAEAPADGLSPQHLGLVGLMLRHDNPRKESWLRQAQAAHPADFWLNLNLAGAIIDANPVEAAGFCRVTLAVRPENSLVYNNLGIALRNQQKLSEAIAAFHKAIEIDPKNANAHNNLGNTLKAQGKLDEAIAAYHNAIEIDPRHAPAYSNLGNALRAQLKLSEAIAAFHKAIEIDPKYANAHIGLGGVLHEQMKLSEAIAAFHKAIEIDPRHPVAYTNLGITLRDQQRLPEALAAFHKAIEINPKSAHAHGALGMTLRDQRKFPEALAWYAKAIELDPKHAPAWSSRGWLHMLSGQLDNALADQAKAIELEPEQRQYWNDRSVTYLKLGQMDKSLADSSKAIELDPKFAGAWFNRGEAHRMLDQPEKAADAYRTAIALKTLPTPDIPLAYHNLAIVLDKLGNKQEARKQYEYVVELAKKAVELAPKDSMAWQTLGWVQYRAGAWKESIEALERSCNLQQGGTGDAFQWLFLAMAHWQLGHKEEARKWYDKAIEFERICSEELRRFRAEAAELLGVKEQKE